MDNEPHVVLCAAVDCKHKIINKRADAVYCSDACRVRAWYHRQLASHAHPHRSTPQWKQQQDVWADWVGHRHMGGGYRVDPWQDDGWYYPDDDAADVLLPEAGVVEYRDDMIPGAELFDEDDMLTVGYDA